MAENRKDRSMLKRKIVSLIHQLNFKTKELYKDVVLRKIVKQDGVILDIGSHKGDFIEMIYGMGKSNAIFSIEPQSECLNYQRNRFQNYKNISYHNFAISDSTGQKPLFLSQGSDGSSLLKPLPGIGSRWATTVGERIVQTMTLSDFIASNSIKGISFLKCDTQGTDLRVLNSAGKFFNPEFINAILIEISLHDFYFEQDSISKIVEAFYFRGYFLGEIFGYRNSKGWLWSLDALFLPKNSEYAT